MLVCRDGLNVVLTKTNQIIHEKWSKLQDGPRAQVLFYLIILFHLYSLQLNQFCCCSFPSRFFIMFMLLTFWVSLFKVLWLAKELVKNSTRGCDSVCHSLIRQIAGECESVICFLECFILKSMELIIPSHFYLMEKAVF